MCFVLFQLVSRNKYKLEITHYYNILECLILSNLLFKQYKYGLVRYMQTEDDDYYYQQHPMQAVPGGSRLFMEYQSILMES